MWLLSTSRAELKYFVSPESVGGYAILSHVWNDNEQSYQDIQTLRALCAQTGQNPRGLASDKIRRCCELAERHGYLWLWIDTCCIDKMSSAELSEAINSMFRYYSLAGICYAYLEDVPSSRDFKKSRWHRRGWTLQELLAPRLVLFVSRSWDVLGSKTDMAAVLEECTGIPGTVLQFERRVADMSIAQRMSWAARRSTTRVEDEAYCLMGLFGVHMPTLYGEGRAAFQRLQEEILRRHSDTTLFAW
ncbi:heterokaryon incompatibility protein-domain-containing protein, partial [Cerioporus squamosus]